MIWLHVLMVAAGSSVIASFTDWLFMGVLFHDRYMAHPEIWRGASNDTRKIALSQGIGVISSLAFAVLLAHLGHRPLVYGLGLSLVVWLAGAVPIIAQNVVWMKLHPLIGVSHAAGWLVRFMITALLAAFLL